MNEIAVGNLRKMKVDLAAPIHYHLPFPSEEIFLNPYLGQELYLEFLGEIFCIQCDRKIKKSFQQGYCYPCFARLAECNFCIIHPERCHVEQGNCSQDDWAHAHCNQQHTIYLANSSGIKVGITRETNIEVRWIDQGAVQAIPIIQVANRYQSGVIEVCLKQFVKDKTDWRKLLRSEAEKVDMQLVRDQLLTQAQSELHKVTAQFAKDTMAMLPEAKATLLTYPILNYPSVLKTLSFDKTPRVGGKLLGIKGQYLIFDLGIINIRKFSGYRIKMCVNEVLN